MKKGFLILLIILAIIAGWFMASYTEGDFEEALEPIEIENLSGHSWSETPMTP